MPDSVVTGLAWFCAIGCCLIGGVYLAFSAVIMRALATVDRASAVAAMTAINVVIVRSLFMPLFAGTTLAAAMLAVVAILDGRGIAAIAGGAVYVVGMFGVTAACNVPLNTALAAVEPADSEAVWTRYLQRWTAWNHVRTVASIAAGVLFVGALTSR